MTPDEFEKHLDKLPDDALISVLARPVSVGVGIFGVGVAFGSLMESWTGNLVGGALVLVAILGWIISASILARDGM